MKIFDPKDQVPYLGKLDKPEKIEAAIKACEENFDREPVTFVTPVTYKDAIHDSFKNIYNTLMGVPYYNTLIISLDKADLDQANRVRNYLGRVAKKKKRLNHNADIIFLWNDAPPLADEEKGFYSYAKPTVGEFLKKKGRSMFIANGYNTNFKPDNHIIFQDGDIVEDKYSEKIPLSLIFPFRDDDIVVHGVKACYDRVKGKDKEVTERVKRFFDIYITALKVVYEKHPNIRGFLEFLSVYDYLLSGEMGMDASLARKIPFQKDYGIEIAWDSYFYKDPHIIGQVDLDEYDHKHSEPEDLGQMVEEVGKGLFRNLYDLGSPELITDRRNFDKSLKLISAIENQKMQTWSSYSSYNAFKLSGGEDRLNNQIFKKYLIKAYEYILVDPEGINPYPGWLSISSLISKFKSSIETMKKHYGLEVLKDGIVQKGMEIKKLKEIVLLPV
ncbi:hypothetical protein KY348_06005 [Candidatus Woesearchaeota archaeon]|nr:hypothetical protein [Candidatus Woesearchaeota archaeon]